MSTNTMFKIPLAGLILAAIPCLAQGVAPPDANCDPSVDTPAGGGCTWYDFYALVANGTIAAGSSFTNYYVAANNPPWSITTTGPEVIRVLDGGHQGDMFSVYDNGILLGQTSATPIDPTHSCADDPTGAGTDPAACWNDPLMSRGTFSLAPGSHSITIVWSQMCPGGNSTLQWFEIGAAPATTTLPYIGSMPHIATEGDWLTTFTLVNKGGAPVEANLSAYGDDGLPLMLPFSLVQGTSSSFIAASVDQTLATNASLIVQSSGPAGLPVLVGGAQLAAAGPVDGFAIFHEVSNAQEAVVPLETRNAGLYLLCFDHTNGIVLGVAIENIFTQTANVNVVFRDDTGAQIGTGNISLPGSGHTSFVLSTQFPVTANLRGTAEFDTPAGGQISLLGIRFTPPGTLTTTPVLANVGTTGGSFAHLASGGGWTTTFVLVNAGTSWAQANLNFFADNGISLSLPLSYPQESTAVSAASSVNSALAPGATLLIQSTGLVTDPLLEGSAQLTSDGEIGGFAIFRYEPNGQEAAVPLETRTASGYLIAFDNTAGTATGVAVNNASAAVANIPIVIRDDTGAQIGTSTLPLAANGHSAFVLSTQFPVTANIRGTIEFDRPPGAMIGALGIRTPVANTFTTLPALAK